MKKIGRFEVWGERNGPKGRDGIAIELFQHCYGKHGPTGIGCFFDLYWFYCGFRYIYKVKKRRGKK